MGELMSFTIKTNGQAMPDDLLVSAIECTSRLHHNSTAEIKFLCPTIEGNDMINTVTNVFTFNTQVIIEAGYDNFNKIIFTGIVSAQKVITNELNNLFVIINCKGKEPVITDIIHQNVALTLTYGQNIMSLDFSADKNSTAVLPADSLYETKGVVKFQGTSVADAGSAISVRNIGDSFNKTYIATGIIHQIANGNWFTEAHLAFKESILA